MARDKEKQREMYGKIVEKIVSSLNEEEKRNAALHLLSTEKAREAYEILLKNDIPYTTIKRIMAHSLNNFQKGKGLTLGSYASGIAEELSSSERYGDVVDDMYGDGIIGERQYKNLQESVHGYIRDRSKQLRKGLSDLERRIAASLFGIFGISLLVASGMKITGNVIGNSSANLSGSLAGFILLVVSLLLFWRSFKN